MLEYWQRTLDNIRQKIELHSIKVASEPTQLSDVNLKLFLSVTGILNLTAIR